MDPSQITRPTKVTIAVKLLCIVWAIGFIKIHRERIYSSRNGTSSIHSIHLLRFRRNFDSIDI